MFTPSFNKGTYAAEAIASVLAQEFRDFEYWILENSTDGGNTRGMIAPLLDDPRIRYEEITLTGHERTGCYPTAVLLNRYYAKAAGKYIFYLSDDDLLEPECLGRCVAFMEAHKDRWVCYFSMRRTSTHAPEFHPEGPWIAADKPMGAGTFWASVDSRIDGGQIAHRRECLDRIDWPWFPETPDGGVARHADGVFMDRLAEFWTFHPVPGPVLATHRCTPLSTWDRA